MLTFGEFEVFFVFIFYFLLSLSIIETITGSTIFLRYEKIFNNAYLMFIFLLVIVMQPNTLPVYLTAPVTRYFQETHTLFCLSALGVFPVVLIVQSGHRQFAFIKEGTFYSKNRVMSLELQP